MNIKMPNRIIAGIHDINLFQNIINIRFSK